MMTNHEAHYTQNSMYFSISDYQSHEAYFEFIQVDLCRVVLGQPPPLP